MCQWHLWESVAQKKTESIRVEYSSDRRRLSPTLTRPAHPRHPVLRFAEAVCIHAPADPFLRDTILNGANLSGAWLLRADLSGANVREAKLAGATGLIQEQVSSAFGASRSSGGPLVAVRTADDSPCTGSDVTFQPYTILAFVGYHF